MFVRSTKSCSRIQSGFLSSLLGAVSSTNYNSAHPIGEVSGIAYQFIVDRYGNYYQAPIGESNHFLGDRGDGMIDKQCAQAVKDHALSAISQLSQALNASSGQCSQEEFELIRRGVGLSIGRIETDLLNIVYSAYPE